ncbi:hypothetical protein VB779_00375 [Haloarculaceae archaeon H-GB11]|nr:hypothetical protein [Haloarculaceae archaeon H-GB11]
MAAWRAVPDDWRFVLVLPDANPGRSDDEEDGSMAAVLEQASPDNAERIERIVSDRLLPALAAENVASFGAAVGALDQCNGRWYVDEQGDIYRPPVGAIIGELADSPSVFGAGQSSWGPAVYGVTTTDHAENARVAGRRALGRAGVDGRVRIVAPRNDGATVSVKVLA